jgi:hypothetical protein
VLRQLPVAGPLLGFLALAAGIGGLVWQVWSRRDRPSAATAAA